MKVYLSSASTVLLLIASLIKCDGDFFIFSKGKYIYWLFLLGAIMAVSIIKTTNKLLKINYFDLILVALTILGIVNFTYLSKATVYSISVWQYTGYLVLYLLVRGCYCTTDQNKKVLEILFYFCSTASVFNAFWMFLQWKALIKPINNYFITTGLFFSPNHSGLFFSIGCLCSFFLLQKTNKLGAKIFFGAFIVIQLSGIISTECRGAIVGLGLAIAYFLYQYIQQVPIQKTKKYWSRKTILGIGLFLVASIGYVAFISKSKVDSTSGRSFINQQILRQITQNPFGYGLSSFAEVYNKDKARYFETHTNWEEMKNAAYIFYANNDVFELAFELGIHWMAIFIAFIILLFKQNNNTIETIASKTLLVCILIFSLSNSAMSSPVFIIISVLATSCIINNTNPITIYKLKLHFFYKIIALCLLFSGFIIQFSRLNAENNLYLLNKGTIYLKGENQLNNYVSKTEEKGEELFLGGVILINNGYFKSGNTYMQAGFDRSGKPSMGRVLVIGLLKQGAYNQAETIYQYNKNAEPYRYEARMDLLDLYVATKQKAKAKKIAQEIIDLPVKIPSAAIKEFKKKAKSYIKEN